LHRNVTKIQKELFEATANQANEVWVAIQTNKDWEADLKDLQAEVLHSLRQVKEQSVDSMTEAGDRAGNMLDALSATMQSSQENMLSISSNIEMVYFPLSSFFPWNIRNGTDVHILQVSEKDNQ